MRFSPRKKVSRVIFLLLSAKVPNCSGLFVKSRRVLRKLKEAREVGEKEHRERDYSPVAVSVPVHVNTHFTGRCAYTREKES